MSFDVLAQNECVKSTADKTEKICLFMSLLDPISVILVTAGSRGEALLFRYPFCQDSDVEVDGKFET